MRTILHLSDVHFGRVDRTTLRPLVETAARIKPDLVAVSGDLTQRARTSEFLEARSFLRQLPQPQIVIPGNHDIPLHNVYARFVLGLEKFRRYISEDLEPYFVDDEIAVAGVNTARSLTWKGGRINRRQLDRLEKRLCPLDRAIVRIVVTHHPFDLPAGVAERGSLVGRSRIAMKSLAGCGADLFLAGHLHVTYSGDTIHRYHAHGHSALIIQAGTATSTRGRGECNSFNSIEIVRDRIDVTRFEWTPGEGRFRPSVPEPFLRTERGWLRADA
ncbi:MAG: metallophosphoesterase family protein [Bryobacteraceae bacterium]